MDHPDSIVCSFMENLIALKRVELYMIASYLERDPLMWILPLHQHVNQKPDYDYDDMI